MGVEADGWIEMAQEMIQEFGRASAVTFTRTVRGDYDPSTLSHATDTVTTYTAYAAPVDFTLMAIEKYTIQEGEKMLWVPGEDTSNTAIDPQVGDIVALEKDYRVLSVEAFETENVTCAFLLKIGV